MALFDFLFGSNKRPNKSLFLHFSRATAYIWQFEVVLLQQI